MVAVRLDPGEHVQRQVGDGRALLASGVMPVDDLDDRLVEVFQAVQDEFVAVAQIVRQPSTTVLQDSSIILSTSVSAIFAFSMMPSFLHLRLAALDLSLYRDSFWITIVKNILLNELL